MGKGRKICRGKGGQLPDSRKDLFEEDDATQDVSSDEGEEQERDPLENEDNNSQVFVATEEEPRSRDVNRENPVIEGQASKARPKIRQHHTSRRNRAGRVVQRERTVL